MRTDRHERWLLPGLLLLALLPLPLFWGLGVRSLDALESADLRLRGRQAELELLAALRDAGARLDARALPLDDVARTAVAPTPDGAFLAHRDLVAARGAEDPIAALEALEGLLTGGAGPALEAAARLEAAEVLARVDAARGRRMRATVAALADEVARPAVARYLRLAAADAVDPADRDGWLDEVSGRATDLEELVLLRRLGVDDPAFVARVDARARWPEWLAAARERRATLAPTSLAIVETTHGWFVIDGDAARRFVGFGGAVGAALGGDVAARLVTATGAGGAPDGAAHVVSGVVEADGVLLDLGRSAVVLDLPPPRLFGVRAPRRWLAGAVVVWGVLALALVAAVWRQQRRARELVAARADLIAQVAHELRTPLTVLRMYGESLVEGRVPAVRRDDYLRTIAHEAERLGGIVDRVAQAARAEEVPAAAVADGASCDVSEVVRRLAVPFASAAEEAGGDLSIDPLPADAAARIDADELRLVLDVLLENALRHGGAPPRLHLGVEAENGVVRCLIEDEGAGLGDEDPERMFERWERGRHAKGRGAGMGLFLARRTARARGGDVTLSRGAVGGVRATVTLPARRRDET